MLYPAEPPSAGGAFESTEDLRQGMACSADRYQCPAEVVLSAGQTGWKSLNQRHDLAKQLWGQL